MSIKDDLGDRMKRYEEVWNSQKLISRLPVYARIDGRHFSALTSKLGYPFRDISHDKQSWLFSNIMREVSLDLMEEFRADIVEQHSDEISMGWRSLDKVPFDGKYFKIVSNLASYAGMSFFKNLYKFLKIIHKLDDKEKTELQYLLEQSPSFDCRIYQVPDLMELVNCFIWRQNDCIRGTINQYARMFFSHKQLDGKSQEERIQMLKDIGHDIDDEEHKIWFRPLMYGTTFILKKKMVPIPEEFKKFHPNETEMEESYFDCQIYFRFADLDDKIGFFFPDVNSAQERN